MQAPSKPTEKPKPSRHGFRKKVRTGVCAGDGNRLFDSQNNSSKRQR